MLILQLGYNEPSSSEERNFATVGSAAGHLLPYLSWLTGVMGFISSKVHQIPFPSRISTEPGCSVSTMLHPLFHPFSRCVCTGNHHGIGLEHANCIPDREQQLYFTLKFLYHYNLGCKCNSLVSSDFFFPLIFPQQHY